MMKKTALSIWMFVVAAFLFVPLASADTINLTLSNPVQSGVAGSTLTFDATAVAISDKLGAVYLNGDNVNHLDVPLTLDDTDFLINFPLSMSGGDSFTGSLFTVTLPTVIAPGVYTGTFSILGGLDPSSFDTLATVNFTINATSPVPEPGTYVLLGTGLAALVLVGFSRRQQAAFGNAA
ncbi:PEP-CTERM sorting domain-containing protein [Edaphobacter flagellatus]|uniref:PEP-CTERM sorting domain-containing protein n=1 Tax=Edaphobacter flagellatus TaxID=1933044 RepID=UPI0021B43858|nr:PEP-CTERM sorting domain-containing protein [Edaphobacter flagellatus]